MYQHCQRTAAILLQPAYLCLGTGKCKRGEGEGEGEGEREREGEGEGEAGAVRDICASSCMYVPIRYPYKLLYITH